MTTRVTSDSYRNAREEVSKDNFKHSEIIKTNNYEYKSSGIQRLS